MKKDYMDGYIIERDEHGDWCVPPERPELIHTQDSTRITDGALLASSHLYYLSHLLAKFARLAGHENDVVSLIDDADKVKDAFNKRFFSYENGCYANNTVTSNLLPLRFGMVPDGYKEKVMQHIVNKTKQEFGGHISVGVMGVQHIMRGLTENGCLDLAYKIATNTDYPSWGYMAENNEKDHSISRVNRVQSKEGVGNIPPAAYFSGPPCLCFSGDIVRVLHFRAHSGL